MKTTFLLLAVSAGLACGAELVPGESPSANVEERRAAALSKRIDRFETMKGRVYEKVRITAIDDGGVSLSHSAGTARLRYGDLSPQQRRYFGLDEAAAAKVYREEMIAREAYEKRVAEKKAARREAMEKEHEQQRLAAEKAEERRAELALARPNPAPEDAASIPERPTIKRIDLGWDRRGYSPYRSNYGYYGSGYYPPTYYRPNYRFHYHSGHHRGHGWGVRIGGSGIVIGR